MPHSSSHLLTFCFSAYCYFFSGIHAPGRCSDRSTCWAGNSVTEPYLCVHSVNLAHAHTSHLYRTKYQAKQQGKIGITLSVGWSEPATDSAADRQASEIALQFDFGAWADPSQTTHHHRIHLRPSRLHCPIFD